MNGPTPASFSFIFGLFKQTIQWLLQINVKMSIQYTVPGFEPITIRPGLSPLIKICFRYFSSYNKASFEIYNHSCIVNKIFILLLLCFRRSVWTEKRSCPASIAGSSRWGRWLATKTGVLSVDRYEISEECSISIYDTIVANRKGVGLK